jgi:hypothetical protein
VFGKDISNLPETLQSRDTKMNQGIKIQKKNTLPNATGAMNRFGMR